MTKSKIKITKVLPEVFNQKGFSGGPFGGCANCPCGENGEGDACCHYGCDVEIESHDLILKNKKQIEKLIGEKVEDCFKGGLIIDPGDKAEDSYYRTKTRQDGFCVFHNVGKKGCALVKLVLEKRLSWRMVPIICRIYPMSYGDKTIGMYTQLGGSEYEKNCDCFREENKTKESIWETQKEIIEDLFEIEFKKA